jgi:peptide-methionine (S)-S-oxide reductase
MVTKSHCALHDLLRASLIFRLSIRPTCVLLSIAFFGGILGLTGSHAAAQDTDKGSNRVILQRAGAKDPPNKSDSKTTSSDTGSEESKSSSSEEPRTPSEKQVAVFGGGCFWCIEAVFERVWGVESVVSGYSGGSLANPNYEQVLTDQTGHAEVCRIEFDPDIVSFEELLMIFLKAHDPTSVNKQGPDQGTRYRSVIFYTSDDQKDSIAEALDEIKKDKLIRGKIITEVSPLKNFYPAEDYHQDYFAKHPELPYCEINIRPKIGKFEKAFKSNSKLQKAKEAKKKKS